MTIMTSAGSKLFLSAVLPGSQTTGSYASLTWVEVGEITDMGEVGKTYNVVSYTALGTRQTKKIKGSYNNGTMALKLGRDTTDAGQTLMRVGLDSDIAYAVKITLQNSTTLYFEAQITEYKTHIGSVDQITEAMSNLELVTDILEI